RMVVAVTAINQQIHELAAVLNSPTLSDGVVVSSTAEAPVEATVKRQGATTYVFAVAMRDSSTTASFKVAGLTGKARAEVLGEGRRLEMRDGAFRDKFRPWDVHLYRIDQE